MKETKGSARFKVSPWLVVGALMVLVTLAWVFGYHAIMEETSYDSSNMFKGPSLDHFFGTDHLGRDHFKWVTEGLNISMGMTMGSALIIALLSGGFGVLMLIIFNKKELFTSKENGMVWLYRFLPLLLALVYIVAGWLVSKGFYTEVEGMPIPMISEENMLILRISYMVVGIILGALLTFIYGKRFKAYGKDDALNVVLPVLVGLLVMPAAYYTLVHVVYWTEYVFLPPSATYPEFGISTIIWEARMDSGMIDMHGYLGYTAIGSLIFSSLSFMVLALGFIPDWALKKPKK